MLLREKIKKFPLSENFDANVSLMETVDLNGQKALKFGGIIMQAEKINKNHRIYPLDLMEREVEKFKQMIENDKAIGELDHPSCYISDDFEVLTENGWVSFVNLSVGDMVITKNIENGECEWKPIDKIINEPYKGHYYKVSGRNIFAEITPNHKFLIKNRKGELVYETIENIYNNRIKFSHCSIPKTIDMSDKKDDNMFVIQGISEHREQKFREPVTLDIETFVSFIGLWLAEGSCYLDKSNVYNTTISQTKDTHKPSIKSLLKNMKPFNFREDVRVFDNGHVQHTWTCTDPRLGKYLYEIGDCYTKYIPFEIKQLSPYLLSQLIYWFAIGDGRWKKDGNIRNIFTVSKRLIDDLQECLIKSGGFGNITVNKCTKDYMFAGHLIKAENKKPLYVLNIATTKYIHLDKRFLSIEKEEHDGNVYCISVKDNHNFYVRYGGKCYWTGNSVEINLDRISHKWTKVEMRGNDVYGEAIVLPTPTGKILEGLLIGGVQLGVSSRAGGSLKKDGNVYKVTDFELAAIDVVFENSAPDAEISIINEKLCKNGICKYKYINDNSNNTYADMWKEYFTRLGG